MKGLRAALLLAASAAILSCCTVEAQTPTYSPGAAYTPTYSPAVDDDDNGGGGGGAGGTIEPTPSNNILLFSAVPTMSPRPTYNSPDMEDREPASWGELRYSLLVTGLHIQRLRSRGFAILQPLVDVIRRFMREGLRQVQQDSGLDGPGVGDSMVFVIVDSVWDPMTMETDHLSPWDAVNAGDDRRRRLNLQALAAPLIVPQPPRADAAPAAFDGAADAAGARMLQGGAVILDLLTFVPLGGLAVDNGTLANYADYILSTSDTTAALDRMLPAVANAAGLGPNALAIGPEGSASASFEEDDPTPPPPAAAPPSTSSIAAAAGGAAGGLLVLLIVVIGALLFLAVQNNKRKQVAVAPSTANGNDMTTVIMTDANGVPISQGSMKTIIISPAANGSGGFKGSAPPSSAAVFAGGDAVLAVVDESAPLKRGASNGSVAVAVAAAGPQSGGSSSLQVRTMAGDPSPTIEGSGASFGGRGGPAGAVGGAGAGAAGLAVGSGGRPSMGAASSGGAGGGAGSAGPRSNGAGPSSSGSVAMARSINLADVTLDPGPPLGVGSYGMVRGGLWRDEPVAVKFLYTDEDAFDAAAVNAFRKEVELQYGLRHKNVVAVYGCIVDEATKPMPTYAVVMERLACSAYRRFVGSAAPRASLQMKLRLLIDVATGLRFLHNDGVLHLDMKPGNIMLTSESGDFTAKVADFGLSAAKQAASATSSASKSVTSGAGGGGVGGTIEYMAPELHSLESPTAAADIYALGIIMWEVCAQALPYRDLPNLRNPAVQVPGLVVSGKRPTMEALPADIPAALKQLMQDCWAGKPEARPTAAAVLSRLQEISAAAAAAAGPASGPGSTGPSSMHVGKPRVFYSHCWANKAVVEAFKARLDARGIPGWIDTGRMAAGDALYREIAEGIGAAEVFICFLSPEYMKSLNCGKEFRLAGDWRKKMLPVVVADIGPLWPPPGDFAPHLAGTLYLGMKDGVDSLSDEMLDGSLMKLGLIPPATDPGLASPSVGPGASL